MMITQKSHHMCYMDIGLDSEGAKKLMEVWAAKGMVNQKEAQGS